LQKFDILFFFNIIFGQNLIFKFIKNMDYSKASQMLKFQQEAMKIKKELENTLIESEVDGFVVTINGEMKAEKAEFETDVLVPGLNSEQKKALEKAIVEAINK
jgi:hypothetical protein